MSDVVVTLPRSFRWLDYPPGLASWLAEGDAAGEAESGEEYAYSQGGATPKIFSGERVYVAYSGALIGYAPLLRIERDGWRFSFIRGGGAVAVTIPEPVVSFRGWRYRWWDRSRETPFPDWRRLADPLVAAEYMSRARSASGTQHAGLSTEHWAPGTAIVDGFNAEGAERSKGGAG